MDKNSLKVYSEADLEANKPNKRQQQPQAHSVQDWAQQHYKRVDWEHRHSEEQPVAAYSARRQQPGQHNQQRPQGASSVHSRPQPAEYNLSVLVSERAVSVQHQLRLSHRYSVRPPPLNRRLQEVEYSVLPSRRLKLVSDSVPQLVPRRVSVPLEDRLASLDLQPVRVRVLDLGSVSPEARFKRIRSVWAA